jgi:hypothetical protein
MGTQPMGYQSFAKYLFHSIHWDLYCVTHGNASYEGIIQLHFFSRFPEEWCYTIKCAGQNLLLLSINNQQDATW